MSHPILYFLGALYIHITKSHGCETTGYKDLQEVDLLPSIFFDMVLQVSNFHPDEIRSVPLEREPSGSPGHANNYKQQAEDDAARVESRDNDRRQRSRGSSQGKHGSPTSPSNFSLPRSDTVLASESTAEMVDWYRQNFTNEGGALLYIQRQMFEVTRDVRAVFFFPSDGIDNREKVLLVLDNAKRLSLNLDRIQPVHPTALLDTVLKEKSPGSPSKKSALLQHTGHDMVTYRGTTGGGSSSLMGGSAGSSLAPRRLTGTVPSTVGQPTTDKLALTNPDESAPSQSAIAKSKMKYVSQALKKKP